MAVGVMAVGGVLVLTRLPGSVQPPAAPLLAVAPPPALGLLSQGAAVAPVSAAAPQADAAVAVEPDDRLLRDARLDRYLVAHKQWGSSFAMPVPVAARGTAAER
jgi:sigma-E factor negative regulatory protein RseA